MRKISILFGMLFVLSGAPAFAQIGVGTTSPDPSSMLDIMSNNKGFLSPRMTTYSRTHIVSPAEALMVYDLDTHSYWFIKNGNWIEFLSGTSTTGWSLTGNSATNPSLNFIGTIDTASFVFKTNNLERMRITNSGMVGIGTSNPTNTLHVSGTNPIRLEGLQTSSGSDFLVTDNNGVITKRINALGGLTNVISYSVTYQIPHLGNNDQIVHSFTVPGAVVGSGVLVGPEADLSLSGGAVVWTAWVSAANTVTIRFMNVTNHGADPPNTVFHLLIFQ